MPAADGLAVAAGLVFIGVTQSGSEMQFGCDVPSGLRKGGVALGIGMGDRVLAISLEQIGRQRQRRQQPACRVRAIFGNWGGVYLLPEIIKAGHGIDGL